MHFLKFYVILYNCVEDALYKAVDRLSVCQSVCIYHSIKQKL